MNQSEKRLFLIQSLLNERPSCQKQIIPRIPSGRIFYCAG